MAWSFKLLKIGDTEVRIHVTFALLLIWIWFMYYRTGGTTAAWQGTLLILAAFACVLLHEVGHVFAARRYGIKTPEITLLPIGGVAHMERMPQKPGQEIVVAIAGPLVNIVIVAGIWVVLASHNIEPGSLITSHDPSVAFLIQLASVNVFLVLFNILPAFPMDGGRVLRAMLATRMPRPRATQIAARIGQGMALVFGILGLFYNPLLIFIAIFIYLGAASEAQATQMRDIARGLLVQDVMETEFWRLDRSATIEGAVEALMASNQHVFPVIDAADHFIGLLTLDNIVRALTETGPTTPVAAIMRVEIPTVETRQSLDDALMLMQNRNVPALAVLDAKGRLTGLLTRENISEMIIVGTASAKGFRFGRLRKEQFSRPVRP